MLTSHGNTFLTTKMESGDRSTNKTSSRAAEPTISCTITRVTTVSTTIVETMDFQTGVVGKKRAIKVIKIRDATQRIGNQSCKLYWNYGQIFRGSRTW